MWARLIRLSLVVALMGGVWDLATAEVSVDRLGAKRVNTLMMDIVVMGITDGADPIPQLRWKPWRRIEPAHLLNPSGQIRGDGRPDVAFHPYNSWPFVVWAYNNGPDHDVAYSVWNGTEWIPTEFLTHGSENDVDPRVFVSRLAGLHVVWSQQSDHEARVMLVNLRSGLFETPERAWSIPVRVSPPGEHGFKPTVGALSSRLWVGYERLRANDDGTPVRDVVVRQFRLSEDGSGVVMLEGTSFPSQRARDLDPVLHVHKSRVWIDWKFDDENFAFAVFDGETWTPMGLQPWTDPSWLGVETARKEIQRRVLERTVEPVDDTALGR